MTHPAAEKPADGEQDGRRRVVGSDRVHRALSSANPALRRWALRLPQEVGRAATLALVAVLTGLAIFGSYVAINIQMASENAQRAVRLNDAFQDARFTAAQENAIGLEYRLSPSPSLRLEYEAVGQRLQQALALTEASGDPADQAVIRQIRNLRAGYLDATQRMLLAVDAGDMANANAIAVQEIGPPFDQVEILINDAAVKHHNQSVTALAQQAALVHHTLEIGPLVLALSLLLVGFLTLVLEVNRRARDAKSLFLARVSHELRTPLNAILGFSQLLILLEGATLNGKQRRYVDNIESSGRHLLDLINEVLDMSKAEAGKMEVRLAAVPFDELILAAMEEITPLMVAKQLSLQPLAGTRGLIVEADPMRLRQILLNGLSNAIKFTPEGGSVGIATRAAKGTALIGITDSGRGIPAAQLARMFGEFEQLNSDRTRTDEGTGLGLPLSKRLVELMGGSLRITSQVGLGTTFEVRLPLAEKSTAPAPRAVLPVSQSGGG